MFHFRLAFSCIWEVTSQAQIVKTKFTKSIICSKVRQFVKVWCGVVYCDMIGACWWVLFMFDVLCMIPFN